MGIKVFVSHDWQDEAIYIQAIGNLTNYFGSEWKNLSVPRGNAIKIAETKKAAWDARESALVSEQYALVQRQQQLQHDSDRITDLQSASNDSETLRQTVAAARKRLQGWSDTLPNEYARERYVSGPLRELANVEQALNSRDLLDRYERDAIRILSTEIVAVNASIAQIDCALRNVREERARTEKQERLVEIYGGSFAFQKMPPHKNLLVDRLLAEQLSALVAQADVVLLLINDFGMFKAWIHYEMTLAIRHWKPIVAVLIGQRGYDSEGLLKDLSTFAVTVTDWDELPIILRRFVRDG